MDTYKQNAYLKRRLNNESIFNKAWFVFKQPNRHQRQHHISPINVIICPRWYSISQKQFEIFFFLPNWNFPKLENPRDRSNSQASVANQQMSPNYLILNRLNQKQQQQRSQTPQPHPARIYPPVPIPVAPQPQVQQQPVQMNKYQDFYQNPSQQQQQQQPQSQSYNNPMPYHQNFINSPPYVPANQQQFFANTLFQQQQYPQQQQQQQQAYLFNQQSQPIPSFQISYDNQFYFQVN